MTSNLGLAGLVLSGKNQVWASHNRPFQQFIHPLVWCKQHQVGNWAPSACHVSGIGARPRLWKCPHPAPHRNPSFSLSHLGRGLHPGRCNTPTVRRRFLSPASERGANNRHILLVKTRFWAWSTSSGTVAASHSPVSPLCETTHTAARIWFGSCHMSWPIFRSSSPAPGNSICPGTWNSGLTWTWFNPDSLPPPPAHLHPPPPAHLHPGQKQSRGGRGCFFLVAASTSAEKAFRAPTAQPGWNPLAQSSQSSLICRLPGDAPSFFCVNEHVAFWVILRATVEVTALELEYSAAF